jgi:hypothetical protein
LIGAPGAPGAIRPGGCHGDLIEMWIMEEYDAPHFFLFLSPFWKIISVPHSNAKWRFPDHIRFRSLFNQDSRLSRGPRGLVRVARAIWRWRNEVARQQLAKEMPKEETYLLSSS